VLRSSLNYNTFKTWLRDIKWTPESKLKWQEFYNDSPRDLMYGGGGNFTMVDQPRLPKYEDFKPAECQRHI
jgi:hypothetical protein